MERAITKRVRRPTKTLEAKALPEEPQSALATKCPLTAAINAIGGKWSLICLYWLHSGTRRFNELHRLMPDISHKVLTATLRNLEHEGLVCRTEVLGVPLRRDATL